MRIICVLAPFAGIITARNVDIGDLISIGGARELFHLAQPEALRVYVRVPQTQAADIRAGQTAEVLVPELPEEPFPAKVVTTSEAVSATSRTLLTELQADNSKGRIRIGSYAQVRFASITAAVCVGGKRSVCSVASSAGSTAAPPGTAGAGALQGYWLGGFTSLTNAPFASLRMSRASFWTSASSLGRSI
jgi:Barrel-sandwich domain of CusB or HlyD membrane-fusion